MEIVAAVVVLSLACLSFVACPLVIFLMGEHTEETRWTRRGMLSVMGTYFFFTGTGLVLVWVYYRILL